MNRQPMECKGSHFNEHHLGKAKARVVGAGRGEAEGSGLHAGLDLVFDPSTLFIS